MNTNDSYEDDSKYILIDRSDPSLMWNCAVSIIIFAILLFFIFMNWKPQCSNNAIFENIAGIVDGKTIDTSFSNSGIDSGSSVARTIG